MGYAILTATAIVKVHDVGIINMPYFQIYFALGTGFLGASSAGLAILRFCEIMHAESDEFQLHETLMRGRKETWKRRLLQ